MAQRIKVPVKSVLSKLISVMRVRSRIASVSLYGLVVAQPRITNGILAIAYAHVFTLHEYGVYGILGALISVLGVVADLGLPTAVIRNYYDLHTDQEASRRFLGSIVQGSRVLSVIMLPIMGAILFLLWGYMGVGSDLIWYFVPILTVVTFFDRSTEILAAICRAVEKPGYYAIGRMVQAVVSVVAGFAIVFGLHGGVVGAMVAILIGRVASSLAYQIALSRGLGLRAGKINWPQLRGCLAFSLPLVPNRVASWLRQPALRPILASLVPIQAVGLFSLAASVAGLPMILSTAVDLVLSPLYFKRRASGETSFSEKIIVFAKLFAAVLFPVWMFSIVFCDEIIRAFAAPRFAMAVPSCAVLFCASFARSQHPFLQRQIEFLRSTWLVPIVTGVCTALALALTVWLGRAYGILAASWAVTVSDILILLGLAWAVQRHERVGYPLGTAFGFLAALLGAAIWVSWGEPLPAAMPELAVKVAIFAISVIVSVGFWIWPNRNFIRQLARN